MVCLVIRSYYSLQILSTSVSTKVEGTDLYSTGKARLASPPHPQQKLLDGEYAGCMLRRQ